MLADEDDTLRKHAVANVVSFRKTNVDQAHHIVNTRHFLEPKINTTAKSFYEIANLDGSDIGESLLI